MSVISPGKSLASKTSSLRTTALRLLDNFVDRVDFPAAIFPQSKYKVVDISIFQFTP